MYSNKSSRDGEKRLVYCWITGFALWHCVQLEGDIEAWIEAQVVKGKG